MADVTTEVKAAKDKIVTFVTDVAGFCRGDVINLSHPSFDKDLIAKVPKNAYVAGEVALGDLEPNVPVEEE